GRRTIWEARSQDVEVSVESPASPAAALRVAFSQLFVGETFEALGFFSLAAVISQGRTIFPLARIMVAAISCNCITARTFAGNGRRARACRRCSLAANILAISGLTPSTASIYPQVDAASTRRQESLDRGEPVR